MKSSSLVSFLSPNLTRPSNRHRNFLKRAVSFSGWLMGAGALTSVSHAANLDFDNDNGNGNWNTPANWTGDALPAPGNAFVTGDNVFIGSTITPPITVAINGTLTNDTIRELGLGRSINGTCTINHSAGDLSTTSWLNIGQGFGEGSTIGIYNLSGGSVTKLVESDGLNIFGAFSSARGELHISGTGSWNILDDDGDTRIGGELVGASNTVGVITISDSGSFHNVGKVYVGYAGQGTVEVSGSGSLSAGELFLGNAGTSTGLIKMIGSSATVSSAQDLEVLLGNHTLEWVADASGVSPIAVTGTVTLNNASLIADLAAFPGNDPVILIQNDGSDAVVGTFNGLAEGATVGSRVITYTGGDGNDVALVKVTSVVNASAPSFNFQNPVVVPENTIAAQVDITNFISSYQGNPIRRYNTYGNLSTNLGIFAGTPSITTNGTLSFIPRAGVNGTATLAFDAQDNSGGESAFTAIQYVTITVSLVNFPPSFSGAGDQNSLDTAGPQSVPNFITGFSANDAEQSLVGYTVMNDNTTLFATQPAIANNGTLTYTPAVGNFGTANVSVTATDNGADNNVSAVYQFVITIDPDSPVHYVSAAGSNTFPYFTPATAAHTIQDAVDAAEAGDTVLVADGTYSTGGRAFAGENLANRVVIDKDIRVVSENGAATTTITGAFGTGADAPVGPDAVRGVRLSGGATLEGFTITEGSTINLFPNPPQDGRGGGVFISGNGLLLNCQVNGCRGNRQGGGISNDGTAGTIIRGTTIENNATAFTLFNGNQGGGFYLENATVEDCSVLANSHSTTVSQGGGGYLLGNSTLTGTTFFGNTAGEGGGVYLMGDSGMSGNSFLTNTATDSGGGAYLNNNSGSIVPVSISDCLFNSNVAQSGLGGGLYARDVEPTLSYCRVQGNEAGSSGGGIFIGEPGHLDHCLVTGNLSGNLGGGAYMGWGSISSSTFSGNNATNNGGAIAASSAVSTLACLNTIVWENQAGGSTSSRSASVHQDRNGFISFQNCVVANSGSSNAWAFGSNYPDLGGNLDADPVFIAAISPAAAPTNDGDFHLNPATSPALDAGGTGAIPLQLLDLDETPRVRGVNIDPGVYENNVTNPWTGLTNSDWATPTNWADGIPDPFEELFFTDAASSLQVDLDGPRNADVINIDSDQTYTFNNSSLAIARFLGAEGNATHQLNSAIALQQDNEWRAGTGTTLQANGPISDGGAGRVLTKTGSGRLELSGANSFSGGLAIENGSVAFLDDLAAGTGPITATIGGDSLLQADFANGPEFPILFPDGFVISYTDGDAHFNGTTDSALSILRTGKADFIDTDFVGEVTVTVVNGGLAYFGFGDGRRVAPTYEPLTQPHIFAKLSPDDLNGGDFIVNDDGVENNPPTSGEVGSGTHRVRMTFDQVANQLVFAIHKNYTGGPFVASTTFNPIDCSDNAFTDTNSRLFFGGNLGVRFDDFIVQFTGDDSVALEYGNNVTIANPIVLQRPSLGAGTDPVAFLSVSTGLQDARQDGPISESGAPFGLRISGLGDFTLGGQNTYTGGTVVEAAGFYVAGTTGSGPVEFTNPSGNDLGGTGVIGGPVIADDSGEFKITPGFPIDGQRYATLTFQSTLAPGGFYDCDIDGPSHDKIIVANQLDISRMTAVIFARGVGLTEHAYVMAEYGSLTGPFAGIQALPPGYVVDYAYNDGTGSNHVALVRVPEVFTFNGSIDDDFLNPGNWTGSFGGIATPATMGPFERYVLAANATLDGAATLTGNFAINPNRTLTVGATGSLTLDGHYDLAIESGGLLSVSGSVIMNSSGSSGEPAMLSGPINEDALRIESTGSFTRTGRGYSTIDIDIINHGTFSETADIFSVRAGWDDLNFTNSATGTADIRGRLLGGDLFDITNAGTMTVHRDIKGSGQPSGGVTNSGILNIINTLVSSIDSSFTNAAGGVINGAGDFIGIRNFGTINLTGDASFFGSALRSCINEPGGIVNQGPHKATIWELDNLGAWNSSGEIKVMADKSLNLAAGGVIDNDGSWALEGNNTLTIAGVLEGGAALDIPADSALVLAGGIIAGTVTTTGTNTLTKGSTVSGSLTLSSDLPLPAGKNLTVVSGGTLALADSDLLGSDGNLQVLSGALTTTGNCTVEPPALLDHPNQPVLTIPAGATLTTNKSIQVDGGFLRVDGIWNYSDSTSTLSLPASTATAPLSTTLAGSGSIITSGNSVNILGRFEPGGTGTAGHFTFANGVLLESSSVTKIDVSSLASFDTFSATGNVSLLGQLQFDFSSMPFANPGTYTFLTGSPTTISVTGLRATPLSLDASRQFAFAPTSPTEFKITASAYDTWAFASGLVAGVNAGVTDDPNGDGTANIVHFALDTDPLGDGSLEGKRRLGTTTLPDGNYLTLTIPVRVGANFSGNPSLAATIDGITYQIQGTSDLDTWTNSVIEVTPALSAGLPPLRDLDGDTSPDWEYRTFAIKVGTLSGGFLRVGVGEVVTP